MTKQLKPWEPGFHAQEFEQKRKKRLEKGDKDVITNHHPKQKEKE